MSENKKNCIGILRIISCLLIAGIHSTIFIPKFREGAIANFLGQGQIGLWIFMVLSGYLVTVSFEKSGRNVGLYIKKRFIRIVPLYWSYLIILIIISKITNWFSFGAWDWFRQFIFCDLIIPSSHFHGMWALGSLSSFFFFYLVGPALIKKIDTIDKGIIATIIGIAMRVVCPIVISKVLTMPSVIGVQSDIETYAYNTPLSTIVFFIVGILIYRVESNGTDIKDLMKIGFVFILLWVIGMALGSKDIRVIGFAGLIVSAVTFCPIELPKGLVWINKTLSKFTFPFYICHFSLFEFTSYLIGGADRMRKIAIILLAPFVGAVILHYLVEKPLTNLLDKVWVVRNKKQAE